ncbi:hypothetical protein MRX96_021502 [Rhipicephalus microplus]
MSAASNTRSLNGQPRRAVDPEAAAEGRHGTSGACFVGRCSSFARHSACSLSIDIGTGQLISIKCFFFLLLARVDAIERRPRNRALG